jgi:hypothetical protein
MEQAGNKQAGLISRVLARLTRTQRKVGVHETRKFRAEAGFQAP